MLEEMRISGLGVIGEAVLELAPGLTVVSGETGAGKTMIVQGLGLLTGGRADSGLVRPGSSRAVVEGRIVVAEDHPGARRAVEAGAEVDEDALLLARTVTAEGRSRAHVGGRSVPASVLAEIADSLIAVHGQSEAHRLLRPAEQRLALDRYAGGALADPTALYRKRYPELGRIRASLAELTERARERAAEAESLRVGLAEVERVAPVAGEDVALDAEMSRLGHAETLVAAAAGGHAALVVDDASDGPGARGAVDLVAAARRAVGGAAGLAPELTALAGRLDEVGVLLGDVAGDLASYAAGIEADPLRMAAAQDRKADLTFLARAHDTDIDGVLEWAERAGRRLLELDSDGDRIGELTAGYEALRTELGALAARMSDARTAAATAFGQAVAAELTGLAMPRARVEAVVTQRDAPDGLPIGDRLLAYGPTGVDEVELRLIPHPGAPPRPLHKGASGGELSRVMLAVEVVLAADATTSTLVFDEVDAGVGGRAAVEVGRRLAILSRTHQVICITHLPQVAAFADRHLVVTKADDGTVTRSGVVTLDDAGRVRELSRMLAGLDESALARGHAEELLAAAARAKSEPAGSA
ncbi:MAG: DNA repair protein RecN [Frankia sp.]